MPSAHAVIVDWRRQTPTFAFREYNRSHRWHIGGRQAVSASAAPEYRGDAECTNPEEAFAAAISSCHLLTFLSLASLRRFVVDSYNDNAIAHLDKDAGGAMTVTLVELRPIVSFAEGCGPDYPELLRLHDRAHEECFIARSVRTRIVVHPQLDRCAVIEGKATP